MKPKAVTVRVLLDITLEQVVHEAADAIKVAPGIFPGLELSLSQVHALAKFVLEHKLTENDQVFVSPSDNDGEYYTVTPV